MKNFWTNSPEVFEVRQAEYAPMGYITASILAEFLDEIIDNQHSGRSVVVRDGASDEWCEIECLTADRSLGFEIQWPLSSRRMMLRRSKDTGSSPLGETYKMIMEWTSHRDDLLDCRVISYYELHVPNELNQDDVKLLVGLQKSAFLDEFLWRPENEADYLYFEVDSLLGQTFYDRLSMGTEYDAERHSMS